MLQNEGGGLFLTAQVLVNFKLRRMLQLEGGRVFLKLNFCPPFPPFLGPFFRPPCFASFLGLHFCPRVWALPFVHLFAGRAALSPFFLVFLARSFTLLLHFFFPFFDLLRTDPKIAKKSKKFRPGSK